MSFEIMHAKKNCLQTFTLEITSIVTEFITLLRLHNAVEMMQSMNGIVW